MWWFCKDAAVALHQRLCGASSLFKGKTPCFVINSYGLFFLTFIKIIKLIFYRPIDIKKKTFSRVQCPSFRKTTKMFWLLLVKQRNAQTSETCRLKTEQPNSSTTCGCGSKLPAGRPPCVLLSVFLKIGVS